MVCRHLEQLTKDINAQGILENIVPPNDTDDSYELVSVDCYLDRKSIRQKHAFPDCVTDYTSEETEETLKEGFICNQCKQVVIGLHQGFMPGCKSFGYTDSGDPHVFFFENNQSAAETEKPKAAPGKKTHHRSIGFFILAILFGIPIALYQYIPSNMKLGFVAGVCSLILVPFLLSPVTQKIRGKDRIAFPIANILICVLMGLPTFYLSGWKPLYYFLAGYAGVVLFSSILFRLVKRKS